jgi:chemotaxis protein methyltransferase CheR
MFDLDFPELTKEQFHKFAEIIHRETHITLKENKITLLANRLRKRLLSLRLNDYESYFAYLTGNKSTEEILYFLEVITTNETYFWRNTNNFDLLKEHILPALFLNYPEEILHFWTAGCSTGEEPYNMAMELTESMKLYGIFEFKIRASDISRGVVDFAKMGSYSGRKIEKVPPMQLNRYFKQDPINEGYYTVRDDIKQRIDFYEEDLFKAEPEEMHCIFCRNVMIYFNEKDQEELVRRFYNILKPGGFLLIGHAESLHIIKNDFVSHQFSMGTVYQKLNLIHEKNIGNRSHRNKSY